jgi:hypothetical protein
MINLLFFPRHDVDNLSDLEAIVLQLFRDVARIMDEVSPTEIQGLKLRMRISAIIASSPGLNYRRYFAAILTITMFTSKLPKLH